jgi:septum formation protein
MGYDFKVVVADVDESAMPSERPQNLVLRLSQLKAQTVAKHLSFGMSSDYVVLAADTIVVTGDQILGKPVNFQDFQSMMQALSGSTHTVMTAITVVNTHTTKSRLVCTDVAFCRLDDADIQRYWQTGEPQDKTGGYGIQANGGQFVSAIKGSYSGVVGLPMVETKELLAEFGVNQ